MKSTTKPIWPHSAICTLTPHPSGSWCKRIGGKLRYFGPLNNPDAALRKYIAYADAQINNRAEWQAIDKSTITLAHAFNKFLTERQSAVAAGELSAGQYARYRAIAAHTLAALGRDRLFASLNPSDFAALRKTLSGGTVSVKNKITWIRTILRWAEDYFGVKVAYGGMFDKPSRRAMEAGSKKRQLFTPAEVLALLDAASPVTKCFVLLGINCGFGQHDIATLRGDAVDLDRGVITHARGKTGIRRINPLWPETVKALKEYERPNKMLPDLVFVTRFGQAWVRETVRLDAAGVIKSTTYIDAIGQEFDKVCDTAKVDRRGFYTFRHTFRSVADEVADTTAIECLMGHLKGGMGGVYTQLMANKMERLRKVVDHVHAWAFTQSLSSPASASSSVSAPAPTS
jgi:integrase